MKRWMLKIGFEMFLLFIALHVFAGNPFIMGVVVASIGYLFMPFGSAPSARELEYRSDVKKAASEVWKSLFSA